MSERQVEYTSGATVNGIECLLAFDAAGVLLGVLTGGYFTAYTEDQLRPHAAEKIDAARREIENDSITCKIHVARTAFGRDRFPVEAAVVKVRTRYIRTDSGDRPESYGYDVVNNRTGELLATGGQFPDAATAADYGRRSIAE